MKNIKKYIETILNLLIILAILLIVGIVLYAPVSKDKPRISPAQVSAILNVVHDSLSNYDENWNLITNK